MFEKDEDRESTPSEEAHDNLVFAALCLIKLLYKVKMISKTVYLNCVKDGLSRCINAIDFDIDVSQK